MPRKKNPPTGERKYNKGWENLRKFSDMTPEEHKRISSLGGQRTKERYAQRKTFKEVLEWALELPAIKGNPDVDDIRKQFPNLTNRDAMVISMVAETVRSGNAKAFKELRDTTGEIPVKTVNVNNDNPMEITIRTLGEDGAATFGSNDDEEDED